MKTLSRRIAVLLMLFPLLRAQDPETIRVRLQAVSLGNSALEGLLFFDGEEMQPLRVPSGHFHFPVQYEGPSPLTLFVKRDVREEDENPYRPVGSIALPPSADQVVLLLRKQEGQVRGSAVPLREQGFPAGSLMMINFSGRELLMSLGDEAYRLPNGRSVPVRPAVRERGMVPMVYRFADDPENTSLVSSGWFYNPDRRYFVFIFDEDGRVGMRSVTWFETPNQEE